MTILVGIAVLVALMSPENLRSAPTVALVCVLVLLCVPVPVLMLERGHRKSAMKVQRVAIESEPERLPLPRPKSQPLPDPASRKQLTAPRRQAVLHQPHQPHGSSPDTHRSSRTMTEQKQTAIAV